LFVVRCSLFVFVAADGDDDDDEDLHGRMYVVMQELDPTTETFMEARR